MKKSFFLLFLISFQVCAHHGVASLGVAGLEGPGAPIESSSSSTLGKSDGLAYLKLEQVRFKTYTPEIDEEMKNHSYWMYGIRLWFYALFFGLFVCPVSKQKC
jgi:hypothetical protein